MRSIQLITTNGQMPHGTRATARHGYLVDDPVLGRVYIDIANPAATSLTSLCARVRAATARSAPSAAIVPRVTLISYGDLRATKGHVNRYCPECESYDVRETRMNTDMGEKRLFQCVSCGILLRP